MSQFKKIGGILFGRRAVANANNVLCNPSSYVPFAFDVYHRERRAAIDDSNGVVGVDSGG